MTGPHECDPRPLWTATDPRRHTRAHLCPGPADGLLLVIETLAGAALTVALPEAALRRGAQATGAWLIARAELRAEQARTLIDDLRLLTDDQEPPP